MLKTFENNFVTTLNRQWPQFSGTLTLDTNLVEAGISSLDFVKLVVWIEEEFNIEIEDSHFAIQYFPTIQSLAEYVVQRQNMTPE